MLVVFCLPINLLILTFKFLNAKMIQLIENDLGVFWVSFKGETSVNSIIEFLQFALEKGNLPKDFIALYDFSETEFTMPPEDITSLANQVSKFTTTFNTIRTALVADNPEITAYTILYKQANTNINTTREIFSSTDSALDWLLYRK